MARSAGFLTVAALAVTLVATSIAPTVSRADPLGRTAALSPAVSFGQPARLPTADEQAAHSAPAEEGPYGFELPVQQVLYGTALLGTAFTIGFAATGSLPTGIAAAGAVVLAYAVLP
ncbi:MAG: hypothetical protein K0S00_2150 [Xanthobacteraceae bacterium]|nr:hypothetical protein [Xanthobacteraceae bacterium]